MENNEQKFEALSQFNAELYQEKVKNNPETNVEFKKKFTKDRRNFYNNLCVKIIRDCIEANANPYCPSRDEKDAMGNTILGKVDTTPCRNLGTGGGFGIENETIFRFVAAKLRAPTREFLSTKSIDIAKQMFKEGKGGIDIKVKEGQLPFETLNGSRKYYNLNQLENPEAVRNYYMELYKSRTGKDMGKYDLKEEPIRLDENDKSSAIRMIAICNEFGVPKYDSVMTIPSIRLEKGDVNKLMEEIRLAVNPSAEERNGEYWRFGEKFLRDIHKEQVDVADFLYKQLNYVNSKKRLVDFFENDAKFEINHPDIENKNSLASDPKYREYIEEAKVNYFISLVNYATKYPEKKIEHLHKPEFASYVQSAKNKIAASQKRQADKSFQKDVTSPEIERD